ncbi:MAG: tetraacyldisaccharide 4'-kinase [Phycisphaerales bacterium]|nr:MAG: tetraacyldisaccharide 4'-kinase [Phycisphaerales bacterium]
MRRAVRVPTERARRGPVPGPLGRAASRIYAGVVARRNRAFDRGERVTDVGLPVISVGNLSVGGTGKTPTVVRLVRELRAAGAKPAIAMRGYGARTPDEMSDEHAEYLSRLGPTPIVAQPDRVEGIRSLRARDPSVTCVVLDDGFQHRFVRRAVDLVLLDATRDVFSDSLLPAGWLREPVESLARAHAVVLTHAEGAPAERVASMRAHVARQAPGAHAAVARHVWDGVESGDGVAPVESLRGRRLWVACAVGNPDAFVAMARAAGVDVAGVDARRDHARYDERGVRAIARSAVDAGAEGVLTTAKDWVKIEPAMRGMAPGETPPFLRPVLGVAFDEGGEGLLGMVLDAAGAPGVVPS